MNIQWYPGHMTKARRMMQDNIKLVDLVIELVDARAGFGTDIQLVFCRRSWRGDQVGLITGQQPGNVFVGKQLDQLVVGGGFADGGVDDQYRYIGFV